MLFTVLDLSCSRLTVAITRTRKTKLIQCRRTLFNFPNLSQLSSLSGRDDNEQKYHERKILPYTRKQIYDIVADVDAYQNFVPYCVGSRVLKSVYVENESTKSANSPPSSLDYGTIEKEAELKVGFLSFSESYASKVTCNPYKSVEAVASSTTPLFTKLITTWRFQPAPVPVHARQVSPHPTGNTITALQTRHFPPITSEISDPSHNGHEIGRRKVEDTGPTLLSIDLVFEFANPIYAGVSAAFFERISVVMVKAFEERCLKIYGPGRW